MLYFPTFTINPERNLQLRITRPLFYNPITLKHLKGLMHITAIQRLIVFTLSNSETVLSKTVVFASNKAPYAFCIT